MKNYQEIITAKRIQHCYACEVCGRDVRQGQEQLAHRIHARRGKRQKRGKYELSADILNHPLNLAYVCSLKCNSAVLIDKKIELKNKLIQEIKACM